MWMAGDFTKGKKRTGFLILAYALSCLTVITVYAAGGTITAFANLIYIPISIAAVTNGKIRGVIHAAVSGLMIGLIVPIEVLPGPDLMQGPVNCAVRVILYSLVSFIIGYFSQESYREFKKNIDQQKKINEGQEVMISALVQLSESRENHADRHIERTGLLCRFIAYELSRTPDYAEYIDDVYIENIFRASQLHDIGKVGIPDRILLKPGKLTEEEFGIMKKHASIGADTLRKVQNEHPENRFLNMGIIIAQYHHEKWDGSGYPEGLAGEDIPLSARIMAVVDVYDALRTKRVYKAAYSHEESIIIIEKDRGNAFDPMICDILLRNQKKIEDIYDSPIMMPENMNQSSAEQQD